VRLSGRPWSVWALGLDCARARSLLADYWSSGREPEGLICAANVLYCWEGNPESPTRAISARPAPQKEAGLVVRVSGARVNLAGYGGRRPLRAAIERFGDPTSRTRIEELACDVRWAPIGLRVLYANFGGQDPCSPGFGHAQRATMSGAWRTSRGLRIGDPLRRLRSLYPRAVQRNRVWWLASAYSPVGVGGDYAVLSASVREGKVRAFRAWIGAAGD
jgi:hypothetical protein